MIQHGVKWSSELHFGSSWDVARGIFDIELNWEVKKKEEKEEWSLAWSMKPESVNFVMEGNGDYVLLLLKDKVEDGTSSSRDES